MSITLPIGIVEDVKSLMCDELDDFINTSEDELYGYHHTLGQYIRNEYNLWENHTEDKLHPDDLSFEYIKEIQKSLKEEV